MLYSNGEWRKTDIQEAIGLDIMYGERHVLIETKNVCCRKTFNGT